MTNETVDAIVNGLKIGQSPGDGKIRFREGYKFVLHDHLIVRTGIIGRPFEIKTKAGVVLCRHYEQGVMELEPGYAWNGESVSPYDTNAVIRASAVHDAFYQAGNQASMTEDDRPLSDDLYQTMMLIDGAWRVTAVAKRGLLGGFAGFAFERQEPRVLTAP